MRVQGRPPECCEEEFILDVEAILEDPSIPEEEKPGHVELRRAVRGLSWAEARVVLGVANDMEMA